MKNKMVAVQFKLWETGRKVKDAMCRREPGIDGILVTVGLCIIALLLCVVMKDSLTSFITTLVSSMTTKAQQILSGVTA
ncbi:MAG: hypothetical protein MJ114_04440 [Acetatifactor sp.]|nr:hypothetical protein [Acetatifactor sp.]